MATCCDDPLLARTSIFKPIEHVNMDGIEGSGIPGACYAARYGGGDDFCAVEPILSLQTNKPPKSLRCWPAVERAMQQTSDISLLRPPGYAEAMLRPPSAIPVDWQATHLLVTRLPLGQPACASLMLHGWLFSDFGTSNAKARQGFPLLAVLEASNLAPLGGDGRAEPQWLPPDGGHFGWADQHVHRDEPMDLGGFPFAEVFFGSDMAKVAPANPAQLATLWLAAIDQAAIRMDGALPTPSRGLLTLVILLPADASPTVDQALRRAVPDAAGIAAALRSALGEAASAAACSALEVFQIEDACADRSEVSW